MDLSEPEPEVAVIGVVLGAVDFVQKSEVSGLCFGRIRRCASAHVEDAETVLPERDLL